MDKRQLLIHGGVLVVGAGTGFGAGYLVFKKKFERISEEEIASVREAYAKSATPKPPLRDIVTSVSDQVLETRVVNPEGTGQIISEQGYSSDQDETDAELFRRAHGRVPTTYELIQMGAGTPPEEAVRNLSDHDDVGVREGNIFDNPDVVDIDPETIGEGIPEIPPRSPDRPYVIKAEEWYHNETDYDQITLTYWADDDVLADDTKRMITDVEAVVGATNLHRFGFLSDNADIVYVRNDRLKADYEITKDERNYAEIVHGVDPDEINTSGVPRRMRSNDE